MNKFEKIFRLWATIGKLLVDEVRDPEKVAEALEVVVSALQAIVNQPVVAVAKKYLRNLYGQTRVMLGATGRVTITESVEVFAAGIDSDFVSWGLNTPSRSSLATTVTVHEQVEDGTFAEIYGSVGDLNRLWLTQSHVVAFCKQHRNKLRTEGYATFFLLLKKEPEEFFVAYVYVRGGGRLSVGVSGFSFDGVWGAECRGRFVVPQL